MAMKQHKIMGANAHLSLAERDKQCIWHPFSQNKIDPMPLEIVRAQGSKLYDANGNSYYDLVSSWWTALHGHCHPYITQAITEQAKTLDQVIFAKCTHPKAVELVERLLPLLPGEFTRGFYSICGSTAVEVGLKMAYQYWHNQDQTNRKRILAFEGGYHGDTFGAMAVGRSTDFFEAYAPLLHPVSFIPFVETWQHDENVDHKELTALAQLDEYLEQHGHETAIFIYEPLLQGSSGMRICRPQFLEAVLKRLKQYDIVLIADEILTGFGRTGTMFAGEQVSTAADIICLSKGLTSGSLPLALTCCSDKIYREFYSASWSKALAHSHSFDANPMACATACASLDLFEQENTMVLINKLHKVHNESLKNIHLNSPGDFEKQRTIGNVGVLDLKVQDTDYTSDIKHEVAAKCLEAGMLLRPLGNSVYVMPPACICLDELRQCYRDLEEILRVIRRSNL